MLKLLAEDEKKFEIIVENLPIGIFAIDKNRNVVMANSAFEKITGYTRDEFKHIDIFSIIHKDFKEISKERFKRRIEGKEELSHYEMKIIRKDKRVIWIEIFVTTIALKGEIILVDSMIDITDKKIKDEKIKYLSFHDALTGLYNRNYFAEELKRFSSERNRPLSIIMSDINGLKIVNDTIGHKDGDKIIARFASILRSNIRSNDVVARIGGDEFSVIMPNTDESGAEKFIRRLIDAADYENRHNDIYLSVSFGYATQNGQYETLDDLLKEADLNMYSNKLSSNRRLNLVKVAESILKAKKEYINNSILDNIIQNAMERN